MYETVAKQLIQNIYIRAKTLRHTHSQANEHSYKHTPEHIRITLTRTLTQFPDQREMRDMQTHMSNSNINFARIFTHTNTHCDWACHEQNLMLRICMNICTHKHTNTHTQTHTRIHTHTRTNTRSTHKCTDAPAPARTSFFHSAHTHTHNSMQRTLDTSFLNTCLRKSPLRTSNIAGSYANAFTASSIDDFVSCPPPPVCSCVSVQV